jgi:hypothetical protein
MEEAEEEAFKMVERIRKGDSKDYNEASKHLENIKKHEEWLSEIHKTRGENPEKSDKQLFGFEWEDEGGRFELSKSDIEWLCQQINQAGQSKEYKNTIDLDEKERKQVIEFLSGIYGSQDVYRIFSLLDRVFGEEAKNYNLLRGFPRGLPRGVY